MNKKYKIGYTTGVFDLFHVGHLNILRNAKSLCDYLIVGVSTDDVVLKNKGKAPVIPFEDRADIVSSIKYVDKVIKQTDYSADAKIKTVLENGVNALFVGSDWKGTEKWNIIEQELKKRGCDVIYLPRTEKVSTSMLRKDIKI